MDLNTALITIIAFSAVLTVLITILTFIFSSLLNPVKENQARIEKELNQFKKEVQSEIKEVNEKLDKIFNHLKP